MAEHEQSSIDKQLVAQPACAPSVDAATPPLSQATQQAKDAYQRDDWTEAERLCRWILNGQPDQFEALNLLGIIAAQTQRPQEAIELLSRAVAVNPNHATSHSNLGNVLHDLKRYEEALESFKRAIKINPDDSDTHYRCSGILGALNRYTEALESCDNALKIRPDYVEALNNRGNALGCLNRPHEALESFDRALNIKPDYADALNNRGAALRGLKRFNEALEGYNSALALAPSYAEAAYNRGVVLSELKRAAEALDAYEHALKIKPDYVDAHMNLSLCLLQLGYFARGWEEFEWRWQAPKYSEIRMNICAPIWEGQKLEGSLLVWNEHGVGDEIFYAGMLNDLVPYAQSITVCVDPRLVPLFQRSFGNMRVISRQMLASDARFDSHIPLGSLGRYLRRSFSAFPEAAKPYLFACPTRAQNLRANIAQEKRLLCGLSWVSKSPVTGMDKSLRLQDLEPILNLPGIDFVDLQYGDTTQEQATLYDVTGLTLQRIKEIDNFNDIDGLAALIEACDVVVTVSNTTAHLAAALGKPVLLMLPFSQGLLWYWHMEQADNLWYPTVTSFRQAAIGDWRNVIETIRAELAQRRTEHCAITKLPQA